MCISSVRPEFNELSNIINPYVSSAFLLEHRQTMKTQIRRRIMRRLIIIITVCSQYVLLKFEKKTHPTPLKFKMGSSYWSGKESPFGLNGLTKIAKVQSFVSYQ